MNLSKFIQHKIFSRLIILYVVLAVCFLIISYFGLERETKRYFLMSSGFITSSTEQLINEGDHIRVQMNIEQFSKRLNESSDFKICPEVFLDNLRIAHVECTGHFLKEQSITETLNNSKQLRIDLKIDYDTFILTTFLKVMIFSLLSFLAFIFIKKSIDLFTADIITPLEKWSNWAQTASFNEDLNPPNFSDKDLSIKEFKNFNEFTQKAFMLQKDYYMLKISEEKSQALSQLAKEVSHDIRSPLTALRISIDDVENIPKEQRNMIRSSFQRINDIANNLLNYSAKENTVEKWEITLIAPIIDAIISEKRLAFRSQNNVSLEFSMQNTYGLFTLINTIELKRILSNLINNSFEAMDKPGKVIVKLTIADTDEILISVVDNGKGMTEEVLKRLGEKDFSHGKNHPDSGHGVGFSHAKKSIESLGGRLTVESKQNIGTTVNIYLKKAHPPRWFVSALVIPKDKIFFILDDDLSLHQAWSDLLPVKCEFFNSEESFIKRVNACSKDDFFALIDFELSKQDRNGIEIIQSLSLVDQAILVTGHSDDKNIIDQCLKSGIRLIPKSMIPFIPIEHERDLNDNHDYVYIDDDALMLKHWQMRAKRKNLNLLTLKSVEDFELYLSKIDKESTSIYIDSNLGDSKMSGEEFAQILHDKGYKKIFIASGYEASHFEHLKWLTYSGKDCPF
jgi:signal transduction histidine kinase